MEIRVPSLDTFYSLLQDRSYVSFLFRSETPGNTYIVQARRNDDPNKIWICTSIDRDYALMSRSSFMHTYSLEDRIKANYISFSANSDAIAFHVFPHLSDRNHFLKAGRRGKLQKEGETLHVASTCVSSNLPALYLCPTCLEGTTIRDCYISTIDVVDDFDELDEQSCYGCNLDFETLKDVYPKHRGELQKKLFYYKESDIEL